MSSISSPAERVGHTRTAEHWLGVLALVVTGGIHLALVPAHFEEAAYAGWLFLGDGAVALVLALLLAVGDRRVLWAAAGAVGALTVAAYVLSRTAGLPRLGDDAGDWTDPWSFPALAAEAALVAIAVIRLSGSASPRSPGR